MKNEMSGFGFAVHCFTNLKNSILIQSLLFAQFEKYTDKFESKQTQNPVCFEFYIVEDTIDNCI